MFTIEWTNDAGERRIFPNETADNMAFLFMIAVRMGFFPTVTQTGE